MMVEMAIVGPVFFLFLFFIFEVAYDQFLQEVLEGALAVTARQVQLGTTQLQNGTNTEITPEAFVSQYFCPNAWGFLNCNNLYVRLEVLDTTFAGTCTDVYQTTTGRLPVSGNVLQLGSFNNQSATGTGSSIAPSVCDTNATGQGFCSPGKNEFVVLTAIYVAPSFLGGLMPAGLNYKYPASGGYVRAQLASTAFQTENLTAPTNPKAATGYVGC